MPLPIALALVFVLAYSASALEHPLKTDEAASALAAASRIEPHR